MAQSKLPFGKKAKKPIKAGKKGSGFARKAAAKRKLVHVKGHVRGWPKG